MITDRRGVQCQPRQGVGASSRSDLVSHAQALSPRQVTDAVTLVLGFSRTPSQAVLCGPTGARLLAQPPLNHFKILLVRRA